MRAAWLLLFVLLAGCGGDPPPVEPGEPTFGDAELPPGRPFAVLSWVELASVAFTLTPAQPPAVGATIPNGTLSAYANLTLEAGAAYGVQVQLGDCRWARDTALVAGQAFAVDCGGVAEGAQTLTLGTTAGAARGTVSIVALVCQPDPARLPCPPRFPVTTS